MSYHINTDKYLLLNQHVYNFDKCTEDELKKMMLDNFNDIQSATGNKTANTFDEMIKSGYFLNLIWFNLLLKTDREGIDFDLENVILDPNDEPAKNSLIGIHSFKDFSFFGMSGYGDWEQPVFFIIYVCDGKLRIYIPILGNVFNRDTNQALGNGESLVLNDTTNTDNEFLSKELGIEVDVDDGFDMEDIEIDWDLIKEDICSRFKIK